MLTFHRQHHQETAAAPSDLDESEQQVAERYSKAVEQLRSKEAPVRFGALHALERLAQDSPAHRQIIVNVICAYLRRPFSPTAPASKPEAEGQKEPGTEGEAGLDGIDGKWQQERQVRLSAQRILAEHLRDNRAKDQQHTDPSSSRFWLNIRLDLTGATLIDFNLVNATVADANFHRAVFSGDALFGGATFTGATRFGRATFGGDASFGGATFTGDARFGRVVFSGDAFFGRAVFSGAANFHRAAFRGAALFSEAAFSRSAGFHKTAFGDDAGFHKAAFRGDTGFRKAAFGDDVGFSEATFGGDAWFDKAAFGGDAGFGEAAFTGVAGFGQARFGGDAWFGEAAFGGDAWFGQARFGGDAWFSGATFGGDAGFDRAAFSADAWFGGASFGGHTWFGEATFGGDADALHFEEARILSPGAAHAWPTGWRLADADSGGCTIVGASDDRGS